MHRGTEERTVNIRVGCAAAYVLWGMAFGLMLIGTWLSSVTWQNWGLVVTGLAVTATVRQYFVSTNRMMRAAFDYGREQGRADVTPLRR